MPHAVRHIAAPCITTLVCRNDNSSPRDLRNRGRHAITTNTYVKLDTVTPGCVLYFTTDGLTPDPDNRVIDGVERTFKYKGPFKLRSGTRVVRALALCRANRRLSQESKHVFKVVEATEDANETLSEVSSLTTNTTSDDFFDFPSEPSALRADILNSRDGLLLYQGNWADYSALRRQWTDSEADLSSTVSDVYTDMTPPPVGFDSGQRTSRSTSADPLVKSCFGDFERSDNPMDDLSDLETEVSNYFRKGHQHDCGPSRNGVSLDTFRSGSRGYALSRTPTPRVQFQMDETYHPSSESICHHGGRDEFHVGYRSTRPGAQSALASSPSRWHGPLLAEEGNGWDRGLHDPRSARSDSALPRHAWDAEIGFEPQKHTHWVGGVGYRVLDPRVRGQHRGGGHQGGQLWTEEEKAEKGKLVEEASSSSSSSSTSSSSSSSTSSDSSGDSEDGRADSSRKKDAKKDDVKKEGKKLEKDENKKQSVDKFKEGKKKGEKEKSGEKEKKIENEKKGERQKGEKQEEKGEVEKKGEKELKETEKKKKGEKRSEEKTNEEKEKKHKEEKETKKNKLKEENEDKVKKGGKEFKKKDEKDREKKMEDEASRGTKKIEKKAAVPVKNNQTGIRQEGVSDTDSEVVKETMPKPVARSLQTRDGSLHFVNDSGTQINLWGVSPDDVIETLSTVLPSRKGRRASDSQSSTSEQSFKQPKLRTTGNAAIAKQTSGKLPSKPLIVAPPVVRVQQQEQQSIFSSAKRFFKGSGKPGKDSEERATVRAIKGALDSKLGYLEIRKACIAEGRLWEDPDFSADEGSLYFGKPPMTEKIVWKRPRELCNSPQLFVGGASRFDVVQGLLGDCWLLAAVASLTSDEKLLHRVVPPDQSFDQDYAGIFHCCLWRYGVWLDVCIDDRLPTVNGKLVFMHSQQNNEFWSALLEKAYAKLCGSYGALSGGLASEAMTDFTGGIVERFNFREELPDDMLQILMKAYERHSLMSCSIEPDSGKIEDKLENGLIIGHAYSITGVKMVTLEKNQKVGLVRVRNPWGNQYEWKGAWSDQSREWDQLTEEQKKSLELVFDHDGEFWMSFRDFSTYFHLVEICILGPDELASTRDDRITWLSSIQDGGWRKKTNAGGCRNYRDTFWMNPQYRILITDADENDEESLGTVVVGLLQKGGRKRRIEGQSQLTIGYDIYEINDHDQDKTMTKDYFLSKAPVAMVPSYSDMREVCGRHRLPPGNYVVVPTTFDPNEEADFLLRIFTEKEAKMTEVDEATSVIQPEALGIIHHSIGAADAECLSEAEQKFSEHSGEDGSIDAFELQRILNDVFTKDFDFGEFDLNLCRSLVAMNDVNCSGLLDVAEFKRLWADLQSWKIVYLQFDQDHSRYFNSNELREALASVGFKLSNATLSTIVARCSDRDGHVHYDDFVFAVVRLRTMFDTFHAESQSVDPAVSTSKVNFTLDEFIRLTF